MTRTPAGDRPEQVQIESRPTLTIPSEERMMLIPGDWARIRRHVGRLGEPLSEHATTWAATALGGFLGLVGTAVTLGATDSHAAPGVIAGFWVAAIAAALFAICFYVIGKTDEDRHKTSVRSVCEDMDDVAERAGFPALGVSRSMEAEDQE